MFKIVSIDDSKVNNAVIGYAIEAVANEINLEYHLETFTNPLNGLNYLKNNKSDLLFLDIMMPNMDGFELLAHLREFNKNIYVCMVTALKDEDSKREAKELGANGYISKPYDDIEIKRAVKEALSHKEALQNDDEDYELDEFIDFDEEFEDSFSDEKEAISHLNSTHKDVISAESFMAKLEDFFGENLRFTLTEIETVLEDINGLQFFDGESMIEESAEILSVLKNLQDIIDSISDFELEDMSNIIVDLIDTFIKLKELDNTEKLNLAGLYMKSIIDDLKDWLNEVFIAKTANNINYANASFYNSVITLKTLL